MKLACLLDSGSGLDPTAQGGHALSKDWRGTIISSSLFFFLVPLIFPWTSSFAYTSLKSLEKFILKRVGAWLIGLFPVISTQVVNNELYSKVYSLWAVNLRADKAHLLQGRLPDPRSSLLTSHVLLLCYKGHLTKCKTFSWSYDPVAHCLLFPLAHNEIPP